MSSNWSFVRIIAIGLHSCVTIALCLVVPSSTKPFFHHDSRSQSHNNVLSAQKLKSTLVFSKSQNDSEQDPIPLVSLFEDMENDSIMNSTTSSATPRSTYTLNIELESLLTEASTFGAKTTNKARSIFSEIKRPNAKSYLHLIQIYGKANQPELAQNVLNEMLSIYLESKDDRIKPNKITFTSAIDAWSQSSHPKAALKAEQLLEQMMELYHDPDNSFGKEIQPNSITFDTVLHAFSKSKNQAKSAEAILEQMDFIRRNTDWDVKPNVVSFTNVVNAWGNQKGNNAQRAQEVMDRMEEIHQITKDNDFKLNTIIMNCVMDAWTKESNWKKAMAILTKMEELYEKTNKYQRENSPGEIVMPNTISYNIALKALVNGKQIAKAQSLFLRMQSFTNPDQMSNTRTYNTMLSGYASLNSSQEGVKDAGKKASLILTKQISLYKEGNVKVKPDTISFSTCMNAIAKSKSYPNKAKKTKEILDAMWELHRTEGANDPFESSFYPNIITYNTILNAAAFSAFTSEDEKQEAFLIALTTFNELRTMDDNIEPDEVTYGNMLKICANLLPRSHPQRNKMAEQLWKGACQSGLVGDLVWNELKRAVPMELFLEWIPPNVSGRRDLPWEWRENVKVEMMEKRKRSGKNDKKKGSRTRRKDGVKKKEIEAKLPKVKNVRMTRFTEYL